MYKTFSFILLFLFSGSLLYTQSPTILVDVFEVKSFGHWEEGESYGHYRIKIVNQGFEHVASTVYLEWIRIEKEGNKITKSIPITEINESGFYSVSVKKFDGEKLILSLTHTYSHEDSVLEIIPLEPGKYKANAV
jgi:hypothetical protein